MLRSRLQRELGGADIGGMHKDLGDRQRPAGGMQILDGEAAGGERLAHVDHGVELGEACIERHGERDGLENGSELEGAAGDLVETCGLETHGRASGIDLRQRGRRQHLARRDVEHDASGSFCAIALDGARKLGLDRMLHTDVERKAHGRALGQRRTLHRFDAATSST